MSDSFTELSEKNDEELIEDRLSYTIMDNSLMCEVMPGNTRIASLIIETVMQEKVTVRSVKAQERRRREKEGFPDVVFDVMARDSGEGEFDIEFQKVISTRQLHDRLAYYGITLYEGAADRTRRYCPPKHRLAIIFLIAGHQGKTGPALSEEAGGKRQGVIHHRPYGNDPDVYLVYMEDTDPDTDIGTLVHDLTCSRPKEIHHSEIADVVNSYQESLRNKGMSLTKKQRDFMKHTREQFYEGGKQEGFELGQKAGFENGQRTTAKNLISLGVDDDTIMKATGLTAEEVSRLH